MSTDRNEITDLLYHLDVHLDSVKEDELLSLAEFLFAQQWWDEWLYARGILFSFRFKSDFVSPAALAELQQMYACESYVEHTVSQAMIFRFKGSSAQRLHIHDQASDCYLESLKILNTIDSASNRLLKEKATLFINLSMLLLGSENSSRSQHYAEQATSIFEQLSIPRGIASSRIILSEILKEKEEYLSSFNLLTTTFDYIIAEKDWMRLCVLYNSAGDLLLKMNRFDESEEMFHRSLAVSQEHSFPHFIKSAYQNLSGIAIARQDYERAIAYILQAEKAGGETSFTDLEILRRHRTFTDLYRQMGDFQKAYENLEKYIEYQEKIHQQNLQKNINELEIRYQIQQKEMETALLRSAKEEVERANNLLRESNRELEDYAHIISHDLREPVRMVQNYLMLMEKTLLPKLSPAESEFLHYAMEGNKRISVLISDLLEFSRVGKEEEDAGDISLDEAVLVALGFLKPKIESRAAVCTSMPLPVIRGVKSQWVQLFMNLIENGIKYNQSAVPSVEILYSSDDYAHQITVRDNGIGIAPEYYDKVFVMFQRLHSRQEYGGTGIGLAICKKIMERYGADIYIRPAPEQGSDFILRIPFHRSHPLIFQDNSSPESSSRPLD